jgi:hypothetical protein
MQRFRHEPDIEIFVSSALLLGESAAAAAALRAQSRPSRTVGLLSVLSSKNRLLRSRFRLFLGVR